MISKNNINDIKASHLCYGCGTCHVICAHQAITMQYDNIGRLLPIVDEKKCTDCGLCRSNCPSLDEKYIQLPDTDDKYVGHIEKVYIGKASDNDIYRNSQSGGLVSATVKYLFDTGKIDAAIMCKVEDAVEYTAKAVVITSPDELHSCQKSSYVPIDIVSALRQAEVYKAIAIVGTGCHIQGIRALQNFSKKYKDRVKYTLGLICDRTLCKTCTDVLYGNQFKDQTKRIVWRDKSVDYKKARLLIKTVDEQKVVIPRWQRFALKNPFTNPRCRICFDKLNTNADIVFGDPWGMSNVDWKNGMSVVITRTQVGEEIVSDLTAHHQAELHEAPLGEVLKGQHIEKRKKDVSSALAYYQRKGWLIPSYAGLLHPSKENPSQSKLIDRFVRDALLSKDEITKANRNYLRMTRLKSSVKKVLKMPIMIAKRILR